MNKYCDQAFQSCVLSQLVHLSVPHSFPQTSERAGGQREGEDGPAGQRHLR